MLQQTLLSLLALEKSAHLFVPMVQTVYGVVEDGVQSQSPVHTSLHLCRKGTKEDVEKEVRMCPDVALIAC